MFRDRLHQEIKIGDIILIGDTHWLDFAVVRAIREKSFSVIDVADNHVWQNIDGKYTLVRTEGYSHRAKSFNISNRCLIINDTMLLGLVDQDYAKELKTVQATVLSNVQRNT